MTGQLAGEDHTPRAPAEPGPGAAASAPRADVVIRPARAEEHDRIAEITLGAYVEGGHLPPDDPYTAQLTDVASRAAHGELLVAEVDGVAAASTVIARPGDELAELAAPGEMEFRMLAVAPDFQGRGIARTLVRHLIGRAEAEGAENLVLCSLVSMTAAHALYRSEGFVEAPARDLVITREVHGKDARFPTFVRPVAG
ncbi:N-acetyltransferase [Nesterenkonia sp. HG001]|uniref:GNAT family N-acetyltransferase n=1 Tax=Nesterenkonia sp. HG001 TaxID=2983207 RepID=UPI002AC4FA2A|nr:N-acetyltransferase [Nesterenkonia sp. HG001]MDZ5076630.1 GNAT family N-acetyltransferase [Nesterenkonia sp. HG001]